MELLNEADEEEEEGEDETSDLMDSVVFTPTLQSPHASEGHQSGDMIDLLSWTQH